MKKLIALLCAVLLLMLAGCGETKKAKTVKPYSSTIENSTDETAESPTNKKKAVSYDLSGGDDVMYSLDDDEEEGTATAAQVERGTAPATLDTPWRSMNYVPVPLGGAEEKAQEMRLNVINTKNTDQYYTWTGKTFYVSPDGDDEKNDGLSPEHPIKTLNADIFVTTPAKPGDAILFERDGVWRMTNGIRCRAGVIYGSYGTGQKPTFYGSAANYADEKYWLATKKANIWKITVMDPDVGLVVFNNGELVGAKKFNGLTVLEKNGDYYYNTKNDTLYLYFDGGNPGKYFNDIEIGLSKVAFSSNSGVVTDNLRIKYFASGGIYSGSCEENITVTNCELGFIGGAVHHDVTRLGNCIQQWNTSHHVRVLNNWMYQAYDTGYTWQGDDRNGPGVDAEGNPRVGDNVYYQDIVVKDNIIEYCTYAIEFWHGEQSDSIPCLANVIDFDLSDNCFRYSGYGWGGMTRLTNVGYNIYVGNRWFKNAKNCRISNNIFDLSSRSQVYWSFQNTQPEFNIYGNTFYHAKNQRNEGIWYGKVRYAYDQDTLESGISIFDPSPKKVQWLEK